MRNNLTPSQTCGHRRVEHHALRIPVMDGVFMPNDFRALLVPNIFLAVNAVFPLVRVSSAFLAIARCLE